MTQPSTDRRQQRDTTVNDQDSSKGGNRQAASPKKPPPGEKTRESTAMEDMLEALRAQQNLEDDLGEYVDRRNAFYRESNRQASEAYIKNLQDVGKEQTKEVLKDRDENSNARSLYQSRIQDISRSHIEKLIKHKLEDSGFKDAKRLLDPADPNDEENGKPALRRDNSRYRPELSKLLESKRNQSGPQNQTPQDGGEGSDDPIRDALGEDAAPEGRDMLESAISKLRNRLGGAHKGPSAQIKTDLRPVIDANASYAEVNREIPAPIRTDITQVQASIQRARALRAAADGSQYVPLEDADVQKLLLEYKLPIDYGTVQAIKASSRRLQDSSYYFQRAAGILAQVGLSLEPHTLNTVIDTLKQFEKYQRPSIMNKLYRFLQVQKYVQLYQQISANEGGPAFGSEMELGEALMLRDSLPGSARSVLFPKASREQLKIIHNQAGAQGMYLPEMVDEGTLKAGIQHYLKSLGLPTSKVMIQQLAQSAQNSPARAQALVMQLAARRSLHPDEVSQLQQQIESLPPEERSLSPLKLMEKLGLPLPENTSAKLNTEALFKTLVRQLGLNLRQLEGQGPTREAILLLHELGERTDTLHLLMPKLAEAVRRQPDFWIKRLAEHLPRLQSMVAGQPVSLAADVKGAFIQGMTLGLELPSTRTRALDRVENFLEYARDAKKAEGQIVQVEGEVVARAEAEAAPAPSQHPAARPQAADVAAANAFAPAATSTPKPAAGHNLPAGLAQGERVSAEPGAPVIRPAPGQTVVPAAEYVAAQPAPPASPAPPVSLDIEGLPAWPEDLHQTYPLAREALLVLRLQAQRTDQLNLLNQRLTPLLQDHAEALLHRLERMSPALQEWKGFTSPKPETLMHLLGEIDKAVRPQAQASQPAQASGPFRLPEHQVERTLMRFYPGISEQGRQLALKQLLGASPALMDGFYQLHRLMGVLDAGKAQTLTRLWDQPEIYPRLAGLGQVLSPVLDAIGLSPERRYLALPTQQNQLMQGLQTWLQQGRPEMLQSALQAWLQPAALGRSPLGKLKEQLSGFGLPDLPETLLEEIWSLSEGSADRVDAMALLLRGGYPLTQSNIQTLQPYLEQLPQALRRQGISDILMHFSPQLVKLIDRQVEAHSDLGKFGTLLEHNLPLMPENWQRVAPGPSLPDFARGLQLGELKNRLEVIQSTLSGAPAEDLGQFVQLLDRLQIQLRTMALPLADFAQAGTAPVVPVSELKALSEIFRQLLALAPRMPGEGSAPPTPAAQAAAGAFEGQNPAQSWMQLLQASPAREQPVLLMQMQDQLSGLFYQVKTLLPRLEARSESPFENIAPAPERLSKAPPVPISPEELAALPELSSDEIASHLRNWGIQIQNPELLAQIQALTAGDKDKLDAVAVLLKGHMPLLPAHIEVVAQYVRALPPYERFTSISKILSFLSDELIQHMQHELGNRKETQRQSNFPTLEFAEAEQAEALLDEMPRPLTEQKMQAARLLVSSPLPQQPGSLQAISSLLTGRSQPQQWLGPLQALVGQMQSLLPQGEDGPLPASALGDIQETLTECMSLLQPRTSQLGNWMMGVGAQLAAASERLQAQVASLHPDAGAQDHWIASLLASLLGLSNWLETEEPHKREQLRRFRNQLREQLPGLRQSFESLSFFHAAEANPAAPQLSQPQQQLTQYLPTFLQNLGYPVEVLIQPDSEDDPDRPGTRGTDVQLTVQTHTLGRIYLSLRFSGGKLGIRIGLERRETQRWLAPYLEALQQKLEHLPWQVGSVQTYVMPQEESRAPVIGQHLYKRYGRRAIDSI